MMPSLLAIVERYALSGILVDANLLLLYFVGSLDRDLISRFKRTSQYTRGDFLLLAGFLARFSKIVSTPNILTEVSNLSGQLGKPVRTVFFSEFARRISQLEEHYVRSADAAAQDGFTRLGLTDAAICRLVQQRFAVLTDDFALAVQLRSLRVDVVNFNDIRFEFPAGTA